MRYHQVEAADQDEIIDAIARDEDDSSVIESVLAAIYYHDTEFAGDVLLTALRTASGSRWLSLARMIETFMQMHRTAYLSHAFLSELRRTDIPATEPPQISELIDAVLEFGSMFETRSTRPK